MLKLRCMFHMMVKIWTSSERLQITKAKITVAQHLILSLVHDVHVIDHESNLCNEANESKIEQTPDIPAKLDPLLKLL
ncbi:hypothetical protein CK203_112403 [Vitis vinifera]|uniref:Uncharacterized protein n=1 Tax=Vitis vinifera TaxID=29760 RepID=A0A438CF27_VITVI|nr:hypothetical protein CK203_112403 [Vitis vinifera]